MLLKAANRFQNFKMFIWVMLSLWTITVGGLLYRNTLNIKNHTRERLNHDATISLQIENALRAWGTSHGGVYVEIDEKTPPNPNLAHIPERDITTLSGKKLTLMNPAYINRQFNEQHFIKLGIIGHLTSLKPFRPENNPDPWESKALKILEEDRKEFREISKINGDQYLRLITPLIIKKPCLKCHGGQGYKEGDLRGGTSISIPMEPYLKDEREEIFSQRVSFISLWFWGLIIMWLALQGLAKKIKERDDAQEELKSYHDQLEKIVEERTRKLTEVNVKMGEVSANHEQTARKYEEQSKFLQNILDSLTHPFYVIDANDFTIKLANKALNLENSGPNPTCYQVTHNSDSPCNGADHPCSIMEVKKTKKPAVAEHIHYSHDGQRQFHEVHAYPIFDQDGKVSQVIEYSLDITQRKEVEKALEKAKIAAESASRTKSEFIANLSHEIRTPMNGIMGMTDLLLSSEASPEKQRQYLGLIQTSSYRLLDTINDILDFSKMEAGKVKLIDVPFDLHRLIKELIRLSEIEADKKGLSLDHKIESGIPEHLTGDPGRLRQVLTNLLHNSIKFTEIGGVQLTVKKLRELRGGEGRESIELIFTVQDTGIGISPENQTMIFDSFTQADGSMTRAHDGIGLGLSIAAKLCAMMGGEIWVESDPGKGSSFHFNAIFNRYKNPASESLPTTPDQVELSILLISDNINSRQDLTTILQKRTRNLKVTESGPEGLAAMGKQLFDLVMLDNHKTDDNAFEIAEKIQQQNEINTRPTIIMLTSYGERGDAARCRELGITAYLSRPFIEAEIFEAIKKSIAGKDNSTGNLPITKHSIREQQPSIRILLVEDDYVNRILIEKVLEKQGWKIIKAENGVEALAAYENNPFDLILMDIQMPKMDGFEATRAIRKKEKETGRHVPIIALTAHVLEEDRQKCREAGMDDHIGKPIRINVLRETVEKHLT
ncbi:MAG: response regulator [Proteobacteria bacterium]|nr:response regulator [Pseudomonadota bacterium]MBU1717065.1 response regulator [Pseudomonadota bacterium]